MSNNQNWGTTNTTEGVAKYLAHGVHTVKLKSVTKADWSGGNALDAVFADKNGLEYKHRIFEFKANPDLKTKKGEPITTDVQWSNYLATIKHIFNKCFKAAEKTKFDTMMEKVNSFDSLISNLNSLTKLNNFMIIKLVDDGKGYAKFPKYVGSGYCDFADAPEYNLQFDPIKEGKKDKPSNTESSSTATTSNPWDAPAGDMSF